MCSLLCVLQFYRDVKDWWILCLYFCVPVLCSAVFYGLMTCEMLRHRKGSLKIALSEQLKQVHIGFKVGSGGRGPHGVLKGSSAISFTA